MTGTEENKFLERMGFIMSAAPVELRPVLIKVRMDQDLKANMKSLAASSFTTELLGKTLAHLTGLEVSDREVTRLLKPGLQEMICRKALHLMPEQCRVCLEDSYYSVGEVPKVRCRRCARGVCSDCFPAPVPHWIVLCNECDLQVGEQLEIKEEKVKAKERKDKTTPLSQGGSQTNRLTQNNIEEISETQEEEEQDDEDDDEREKEIRNKRENEEGGKNRKKKTENETINDDEKSICKSFKFGGKCPHGMSGKKQHGKWSECKWSHPKVCNKLLAHGTRGQQGCDGRECDKFHPRMCYGSMADRRCTKERCTYWHCKGTTFTPASSTYSAPTSSRWGEERSRGREPRKREEEGEEKSRGKEPRRQREEEGRGGERRREEERKENETREEERRRSEKRSFLDLSQMIRQEVQNAILAILPAAASGSGASQAPSQKLANQGVTLTDLRTFVEVLKNGSN